MLRAATVSSFPESCPARQEILWLLDQIDRALSHKRNDAVHGPLTFFVGAEGARLVPSPLTNSPRAKSLEGKQLLEEFVWYEQTAWVLGYYARSLDVSIRFGEARYEWPQRPQLPHRGQKTNPMAGRSRSPPKRRSWRPTPSQA